MSRHANIGSTAGLTEMQRIVVEELRRGKSWVGAAKAAGYVDPSGEVDRLKAVPGLMDAVIGTLQEKAASWELLGDQARRVLSRHMRDDHDEWCRSLQPPDPEHGWPPCNCWFGKVRAADANTAARITTDVLGRHDSETLAGRARKEDEAISDEEAARRYLGGTPEGGSQMN